MSYYNTYRRPRPLEANRHLARPAVLGYPLILPPTAVIAGPLGKKTKAEKKTAKAASKLAQETYRKELEQTRDALQQTILDLTSGQLPSTAAINVTSPDRPSGVKLTKASKQLQKDIDKLKSKKLSNAIEQARLLELQAAYDATDGSSNVKVATTTHIDTTGGDVTGDGDAGVVGTDVSDIYYQIAPTSDAGEVSPAVVYAQAPATTPNGTPANADEVGGMSKVGDAFIYAGSVAGAGLALWGLWKLFKKKKR